MGAMDDELRFADVQAELRRLGQTISRKDGEYRVNFLNGTEATAYYTNDLADALGTGKLAAAQHAAQADPPSAAAEIEASLAGVEISRSDAIAAEFAAENARKTAAYEAGREEWVASVTKALADGSATVDKKPEPQSDHRLLPFLHQIVEAGAGSSDHRTQYLTAIAQNAIDAHEGSLNPRLQREFPAGSFLPSARTMTSIIDMATYDRYDNPAVHRIVTLAKDGLAAADYPIPRTRGEVVAGACDSSRAAAAAGGSRIDQYAMAMVRAQLESGALEAGLAAVAAMESESPATASKPPVSAGPVKVESLTEAYARLLAADADQAEQRPAATPPREGWGERLAEKLARRVSEAQAAISAGQAIAPGHKQAGCRSGGRR